MQYFKKQEAVYWGGLVVAILILYFFFSSGQFSVIFTLAGTIQTFGFALIVIKIKKSRSVVGISRETFICYTTVLGLRSILFMVYKGYLPYDSTGDFIFKIQEWLATALSAYILYAIQKPYRSSYNLQQDTVKALYLIIPAFILAILFHSNLNRSLLGDIAWAFTQYLETFAILSQFVLFRNKGKQIETYTSHFVASQAISRILSIIFWIFTYGELNVDSSQITYAIGQEYVGIWFMICQVIHLLIMADFLYYWVKALIRGEGVTLV